MQRHTQERQPPATPRGGRYDPATVERYWQDIWTRTRIYETDLANAGRPYYNLMMFPYPSAFGLHVGNVYAYTGADIHARFQAMQGTRGQIHLAPDASEAEALQAARGVEAAAQVLAHGSPRRVVYVPGRILNIVT